MHGYPEFSNEIEEVFGDILEKYNFKNIKSSNTSVIYKSEYCFIGFFTEYSEFTLLIKQNEKDRWFSPVKYQQIMNPKDFYNIILPKSFTKNLVGLELIRVNLSIQKAKLLLYGEKFLKGDFLDIAEYYKRDDGINHEIRKKREEFHRKINLSRE